MAEVRIKDIDEHEIDTVLAEDIDFEGHLTFKKPLMIKGKFKGEIKSTSALYIGEKAYVEARTEADVVSAKGRHKGDILGHSRVELFSTARVDGDITTPDLIAESGCKFNGVCNMSGEASGKETASGQGPAAAGAGGAPGGATVGAAPSGGSGPAPGGQAAQQHGQQQHSPQPNAQQQRGPQQHGQQPNAPLTKLPFQQGGAGDPPRGSAEPPKGSGEPPRGGGSR
ncbi:MAG: polymer-forming cytoskeletal protein [Spirochaetia bacterium]|jgi:cytoskeletal protein CcmA (bactofilin family)